jgi:tetratricopeptide (TPR) repeat protein
MLNRQLGPLALVFLSLAACGGGEPVKQAPALVAEAYQWNQRAESAFRRGDYQAALEASHRALDLYRSLEDSDGVARELANLSSIYHARGEHGEALAMLAPILSDGRIPFQSRHRVEAAYRAAVITAPGHPREAGEWLDRAERYCQSDCEAQGRILNLRARLWLDQQRPGEARALAQRALSLHEKRGDRQEMANSMRLLGDIALANTNPAEARAHYQRALETDKHEAVPHKIFADLMGIGRSFAAEGRRDEAATYFRRARDVAEAAGQSAGVAEADGQLARDGR